MIISISISGLSKTLFGSLLRYIIKPFSWKYFSVSSVQLVQMKLSNTVGNSSNLTQTFAPLSLFMLMRASWICIQERGMFWPIVSLSSSAVAMIALWKVWIPLSFWPKEFSTGKKTNLSTLFKTSSPQKSLKKFLFRLSLILFIVDLSMLPLCVPTRRIGVLVVTWLRTDSSQKWRLFIFAVKSLRLSSANSAMLNTMT